MVVFCFYESAICFESKNILFLLATFASISFFSCQNISKAKLIKLPENDWLVKNNSSLIGDFIFMLNTDWMAKTQLNVNLVNHFYKQQKI